MNIRREYWLAGLAGVVLATAAFAQTAPRNAAQMIEEKGLRAVEVDAARGPVLPVASACPRGGIWGCDYICIEVNEKFLCTRWQPINCSCR